MRAMEATPAASLDTGTWAGKSLVRRVPLGNKPSLLLHERED